MAMRLVVDTCVWLDLAKDYREQPVIAALEDLIESCEVKLIVPQQVLDEFDRNMARIAEEARRGLQSHFRLARQAVNRFGDDARKAELLAGLHEVDHRIGVDDDAVGESIERIDRLLHSVPALASSDAVKQRVTERALAKKAPYHRAKNSVGDAILTPTSRQQQQPMTPARLSLTTRKTSATRTAISACRTPTSRIYSELRSPPTVLRCLSS